jgi:hypothetical protein
VYLTVFFCEKVGSNDCKVIKLNCMDMGKDTPSMFYDKIKSSEHDFMVEIKKIVAKKFKWSI